MFVGDSGSAGFTAASTNAMPSALLAPPYW